MPARSHKGIRVLLTGGCVVALAWACSSGSGRKDVNYGTDAGADWVPADGSAVVHKDDAAPAADRARPDATAEAGSEGGSDADDGGGSSDGAGD